MSNEIISAGDFVIVTCKCGCLGAEDTNIALVLIATDNISEFDDTYDAGYCGYHYVILLKEDGRKITFCVSDCRKI